MSTASRVLVRIYHNGDAMVSPAGPDIYAPNGIHTVPGNTLSDLTTGRTMRVTRVYRQLNWQGSAYSIEFEAELDP